MVGWQARQVGVDVGSTVDLQHVPMLHDLLNASALLQVLLHSIVIQDDILHRQKL